MSGCHRATSSTPSTSSETTAITTNTGGGSSSRPRSTLANTLTATSAGQAELPPSVSLAEEDGEHPDQHRRHHEHGRPDGQERRRHEPRAREPFAAALLEGLPRSLVPASPRTDHVVAEDRQQSHGQGDHRHQPPGGADGERHRARQSPIHRRPFRLGSAHARPRARSRHQVQGGPLRPWGRGPRRHPARLRPHRRPGRRGARLRGRCDRQQPAVRRGGLAGADPHLGRPPGRHHRDRRSGSAYRR